jgi:hypothetical protein
MLFRRMKLAGQPVQNGALKPHSLGMSQLREGFRSFHSHLA